MSRPFAELGIGPGIEIVASQVLPTYPVVTDDFARSWHKGFEKLGFPLIRIQSAKPELLRRLLPVAERLELKLAYEIHAPLGPNAPEIMKVRDVYEELDSPLLGFVADFSSTMRSISPILLRAVRRAGLDNAAIEQLQSIWATDAPMRERQEQFIGYLRGRDFDPVRLGSFAHLAFNMHGHVAELGEVDPPLLVRKQHDLIRRSLRAALASA
ncbi:hypothetical protein [Arthrobacter ramosus]|uniref:Uncharacterized protein n=1 Tax=Arthrobacter ramosus TaxID=1672 RepID=A0ABV5XXY6_ARTRM|nr:hypothetical protein [Arthrobacter ramosus]